MMLRLYALTLHLFPPAFRQRFAAEMLAAASLDLAGSPHRLRTFAMLAWDAVKSAFRENIRTPRPIGTRQVLVAAALISIWLPIVCVVNQQKLRRAVDRQPESITAQLSGQLSQSPEPGAILYPSGADISSSAWLHSGGTFAALTDARGNVVAANARLRGALPQPPHGIFETIRQRRSWKVTWQPQRGVRIALVGRALPDGTFLLAGQSLLPSESSHARFVRAMESLWLVLAATLLLMLIAVLAARRRQTTTS